MVVLTELIAGPQAWEHAYLAVYHVNPLTLTLVSNKTYNQRPFPAQMYDYELYTDRPASFDSRLPRFMVRAIIIITTNGYVHETLSKSIVTTETYIET